MPNPQASVLQVSSLQHELLQSMVHGTTNAQRLVKRGHILLEAADGRSDSKIAQHLRVDYETVRRWRDRWHAAQARLQVIEATGKSKMLSQAIEVLLTDGQRPGAPATFTFEQFMQIMALAYETPASADRPVSAWTPRELADEAIKRGIVKRISPRTVERFLKGEHFAASSQTLLAHSTA
ncbi:MAG TPA: helix-turn-helix domain-containing protein [Ktedonobacteraceae bacterium]|nr:helix-turn-helix domain-containing protein [Ktedonobacteraceae bacterium]